MLDKIYMINEQISDILERINENAKCKITPINDIEYRVNISISDFNFPEKRLVYRGYCQTEQAFINEIKGYLFDCLDGIVNIF